MVEEEIKRIQETFLNKKLSIDDKVHLWFQIKLLADDFEKYLEELIKQEKENKKND